MPYNSNYAGAENRSMTDVYKYHDISNSITDIYSKEFLVVMNFGDIDHLKSCIINMLNHPGMNILTANLVGNKNIELADGIMNMEGANTQYNKGYLAKHSERI